MPNALEKKQSKNFNIDSKSVSSSDTSINANELDFRINDEKVNVNMRYFQKDRECFSEWQKCELKAFSSWLEKMANRTVDQVRSTTKDCHVHRSKSSVLVPETVSPDIQIYSLKVNRKARIHGFFVKTNFFLMVLDRSHSILESK